MWPMGKSLMRQAASGTGMRTNNVVPTPADDSSVSVADQDIFGILVWFSIPCRDPNTSWEVACAVRERLLAEAARIERETGNPVFPSPVAAGAA